ncbi:MAG: type II toxin-antitoxin system RelE/ParE family toxin [Chlorobiales bacterium]|nr:type II toxin-antitoxin system RelE/ParE family toxin [Chlorobiales bacterium]
MSWTIEITKSAKKDLARIDKNDARRLVRFLHERVVPDPRSAGKALKADLSGLWRYRVGRYRIVCEIQDTRVVVLVLRVAHRKDVYR